MSTPARIDNYGFLYDCHSAALVDREGSVDWWCVRAFDSPSVFGRLLGADAGAACPDEADSQA
ncbi:MAG: trehalase-like domain-containing protein [Solirubrobacteraceae bacterium]